MALGEYVKEVMKRAKARAIILYGSRAQGRHKPWSDYDVLIVAEDLPEWSLRWELIHPPKMTIPIEAKAYTPDEFIEALRLCRMHALDAVSEGKILFDSGFMAEAKKVFEEVKRTRRLEKTVLGWRALS